MDIRVEDHFKLVHHVLHKKFYYKSKEDYEDLFQVGCIGLLKATRTFDESKAIKFSTYAAMCIYNELLCYLRPSKNEIKCVSIYADISEDGSNNLLDSIADTSDDIVYSYVCDGFLEIYNKLSPRDQSIIHMRLLDNYTNREISKKYNLSHTTVSRVLAAFKKAMMDYVS